MDSEGYGTFENAIIDEETPLQILEPSNTEFQSIWPYEVVQSWWPLSYSNSWFMSSGNRDDEDEEIPAEALEVINFLLAMLIALFSMMTFATLLLFVVLQTKV